MRKGESGKVYGPGEPVSMKDAIRMYTCNGAFLTREEKIKGTLEAGKLADMVACPRIFCTVSPDSLLSVKIDMTIVGGKILYDRSA
jgi:predicted amidohydrolase YtcJ